MNKLDQCYLEALSEALKGNLREALELRNEADALASEGFSFSEDYGSKYPFIEEAVNTLLGSYDFTRCVKPDGSAYGTAGQCRKGTEQAKPADDNTPARPKRSTKKSAKAQPPSAANEYAKGHAMAMALLADLQQAIEDMPNPESISGNWGYAGSMNHINSKLREVLAFAGGGDAS